MALAIWCEESVAGARGLELAEHGWGDAAREAARLSRLAKKHAREVDNKWEWHKHLDEERRQRLLSIEAYNKADAHEKVSIVRGYRKNLRAFVERWKNGFTLSGIDDQKDMRREAEAVLAEHQHERSGPQKKAIRTWQSMKYKAIQLAARSGDLSGENGKIVKQLDSMMNESIPEPLVVYRGIQHLGDVLPVGRGSQSERLLQLEGTEFAADGFVPTSLDYGEALAFKGGNASEIPQEKRIPATMEILVHPGDSCAYLSKFSEWHEFDQPSYEKEYGRKPDKDWLANPPKGLLHEARPELGMGSKMKDEKELLLARGTRLRIIHVDIRGGAVNLKAVIV